MKRSYMRRAGPAPRPARQLDPLPEGRVVTRQSRGTYACVTRDIRSIPKENFLQHEGYMCAVRSLPCALCGVQGYTQFCHGDQGKGTGLKTDCRTGWPGCGPRLGVPGCHYLIGTSGTYPQAERREKEARLARETRQRIRQLGLWPMTLPEWPEDANKTAAEVAATQPEKTHV